jgi:hypothetical protein
MMDVGCWLLVADVGCWMLEVEYWLVVADVGCVAGAVSSPSGRLRGKKGRTSPSKRAVPILSLNPLGLWIVATGIFGWLNSSSITQIQIIAPLAVVAVGDRGATKRGADRACA